MSDTNRASQVKRPDRNAALPWPACSSCSGSACSRAGHRDLALRPARAADPARRRRDRAEAVADHRGARRELRRLHALRDLAARQARPAGRPAAEHRDRAALPRRGDADRSRSSATCSSGRSRGSPATARAAAGSCSAPRSGSSSCRARARCWPRSPSSPRTNHVGFRAVALTARLRARRRRADAADRARRPRRRDAAARRGPRLRSRRGS